MVETKEQNKDIEALFKVGAHYAYRKTRRHPSAKDFIYGAKNSVEIFDLEKTNKKLEEALTYVEELGKKGKTLLFVSSKPIIREELVSTAENLSAPYVTGRWIGGTLTNFSQISKRTERLAKLKKDKEKGELAKYTKHEQMLIDREIEELEERFGGIADMEKVPHALFVIDPREESTAVSEADVLNIPVIALANSDCNLEGVAYPIPANDSTKESMKFFVSAVGEAYKKGLSERGKEKPKEKKEKKDND